MFAAAVKQIEWKGAKMHLQTAGSPRAAVAVASSPPSVPVTEFAVKSPCKKSWLVSAMHSGRVGPDA